jgi:hypothetical protein
MSKKTSHNKEISGRDPKSGQFLLGHQSTGGRPRGSRAKLGEQFISDLHTAWLEHGPQVIAAVIRDKPHEMLKAVSRLLPQQFDETVNLNVSMFAEVKDFVEAYRLALSVIGSNKPPKLIEANGRSD